jgi:hypothetical protein
LTNDLKIIRDNRDELLLAEIAALLHDVGKFCDLHIEHNSIGGSNKWSNEHAYKAILDNPSSVILIVNQNEKKGDVLKDILKSTSPKMADFLRQNVKTALSTTKITFHSTKYSLAELIMLGTPATASRMNAFSTLLGKDSWLPALLGVCHSEAHYDKQEPAKNEGLQIFPEVFISSVFGYESKKVTGLTTRLNSLSIDDLNNYNQIVQSLADNFIYGLGDTRRPINEITLWDWGLSVGSLFKAALAASLITGTKPAIHGSLTKIKINHDFKWRLLHISYDGLAFIQRASTIGDMLGRKKAMENTLNKVQKLLEETYPLGNEVYRDENGSAFVVPHLDGDNDEGIKLSYLIESFILEVLKESELKGELIPLFKISKPSEEASTLHEFLISPLPALQPFKDSIISWWQGEPMSICIACGLRPQGWGAPNKNLQEKSRTRKVCYVCLERREQRAKEWIDAQYLQSDGFNNFWKRTIWIDEVADENGRFALITSRFDISEWMRGDLINTMLVICNPTHSDQSKRFVNKNASFARLHRVWRTTKKFWEEISEFSYYNYEKNDIRLKIPGKPNPNTNGDTLGQYHVYQLLLDSIKLSAVWDGNCFISAHNLDYFAKSDRLGKNVKDWLEEHKVQEIKIEEPMGYGSKNKEWGTITIEKVEPIPDSQYIPATPILAEPRTFMVLVPADRALEIVNDIKNKYEIEMGKVRNRLPIHLGIVFADHKTPLRVVLDAGRRMLKQNYPVGNWKVDNISDKSIPLSLRNDPHFKKFVRFKLSHYKHKAVWHVPLKMGDGSTDDEWYPYVFVQYDKDGETPSGRTRMFEAPCPWNTDVQGKAQSARLVHASDIHEGDVIYFTPSTLDFQWLDTGGRRFEIAYDDKGYRLDMQRRPYMLDELVTFKKIWDTFSAHLTSTQIHALNEMIETKRNDWKDSSETSDVFTQFCRDTIANIDWRKKEMENERVYPWGNDTKTPEKAWLDEWTGYATRGLLTDVIELNMKICKKKSEYEDKS